MRLPPPPPPDEAPPPTPAGSAPGIELRFHAWIATRIARGDETDISARFGGAAAIRPLPSAGWRFGIAGDGGTSISVPQAGFKGTWSEWSALGFVSWTSAHDAWELEPYAGFGIRRSSLHGTEMTTARSEAETLAMARGGLWARWRYAWLSAGVTFAIDETFGTPTYTKTGAAAEIFQVPGTGIEFGAVVAVDL